MKSIFNPENNFYKYKNIRSILVEGDEKILSDVDVTIVMPIFNHHRYLKYAIESVINQKTQKKIAILIVDNDSSNCYGNEQIVRSINDDRIIYYRNEHNIGAAGNWNRCIELCKSKYFTFLHDDDMFKDDAIDTLFEIQRLSNADFVFSSFNRVNENGDDLFHNETPHAYRKIVLEHMLIENYCHTGEAVLFNRDLMMLLGGFSEDYKPCFDYALFSRIVYEYDVVIYLRPILNYRIAENDTLSCYKDIPTMDEFIRNCIIEKLNYPLKIMLKYNEAVSKVQRNMVNNVFGGQNNGRYDNVNISERILLPIVSRMIHFLSSRKSKIYYL